MKNEGKKMTRVNVLACFFTIAALGVVRADEQQDLLQTASDEGQKIPDREKALVKAAAIELTKPAPHDGPYRNAVGELLAKLARHVKEPEYTQLIQRTFRALEPIRPVADLGPRVKPFLAPEAPDLIRGDALRAIALHGASGVGKEIKAVFAEKIADQGALMRLQVAAVEAAAVLPPAEALPVLQVAVTPGHPTSTRLLAVRALGKLKDPVSLAELKTTALATEPMEDIAYAAALELARRGALDGLAEFIKRLKGNPTARLYQRVCALSYHGDGFAGVPPTKWNSIDPSGQEGVLGAINEWWASATPLGADGVLMRTLSEKGLKVPKNPNDKEFVAVLLEALDLEPRSLRYAAYDLVVKKTGQQKEWDKDWKNLKTGIGAATLMEGEPADGFADAKRANALREQQRVAAAKWRQWWAEVSEKAQLVDGVWVVR